ncbi:MAG: hypothetical protein WAM70_14585 [Pyrinomonadaceae bacterium]
MMQTKLLHFRQMTVVCLLGIFLSAGCSLPTPEPNGTASSSPGVGSTPLSPDSTSSPGAPTPESEGAMILSTEGSVSLKPKGATAFAPILEKVYFMAGDQLQIGQNSFARVSCTTAICRLGMGTYDACCTSACEQVVAMMRTTGSDAPIKRSELAPGDARDLNAAERSIRELNVGEVTTQFLITQLYSGWKLQETNQELDRLNKQLKDPDAQRELKELYQPIRRKTAEINLNANRVGDAEKLYLKNLKSDSRTSELNPTAAEIEKAAAHKGLAETDVKRGKPAEAIRNLEAAKDIYQKQGDTGAVAETEKRIVNIRSHQPINNPARAIERAPARRTQP